MKCGFTTGIHKIKKEKKQWNSKRTKTPQVCHVQKSASKLVFWNCKVLLLLLFMQLKSVINAECMLSQWTSYMMASNKILQ
jgi:hypothetical protein